VLGGAAALLTVLIQVLASHDAVGRLVAAVTSALLIALAFLVVAVLRQDRAATMSARSLDRTEAQFAAVLRASTGNPIIATDVHGVVTVWNSGAEKMLGYPAADVLGRPIPFLHDAVEFAARAAELDVPVGFDVFRAPLQTAESDTRDWTYVRRDGTRLKVTLTVSTVRDSAGRLTGYIGIATDVSELHTTLRTLDTQTAMYRALLERLPAIVVTVVDEDLRYVELSGAALPSGHRHDELIGLQVGATMDDERRRVSHEFYRQALLGPAHRELWSEGRLWHVAGVPLTGPDGRRLAMAVAHDVTDQRHAAEQLHRSNAALAASEERFRTAFDDAPVGIAVISAHPDDRGALLEVNRSFARLVGRTPEQLVGQSLDDLTYPGDPQVTDLPRDHVGRHRSQKRYWHASGRPVWVEVSSALVRDEDGEPLHFITMAEDITTRRSSELALVDALEQQRTAARALADLDRVRTDVMATISHELRTPLTAIRGLLEMLDDGDAGELTGPQRTMVATATRNANRLRTVMDDLLILARMDQAETCPVPARTTVDVVAVTRLAAEAIRPRLAARGQELRLLHPSRTVLVAGDADQLDRAVMNLLSNASKFSPVGSPVELEVTEHDGRVVITVRDEGRGIAAGELDHVFERFYRGADAETEGIGGTGLGLAMVRTIVDRHGGVIDVDTEPGRGSSFAVSLPTAVGQPVAA
jgi:PAS domain S-box-containing protein